MTHCHNVNENCNSFLSLSFSLRYKKPEAKQAQKTAQPQEDAPVKQQRKGAKMKV
jgi:hypothetical protein